MKGLLFVVLIGWLGVIVAAQDVVVKPVPDAISWGTSLVNPTLAAVRAIRSDDAKCRLSQLLVSEGIGNAAVLTIKHFVVSPRPCLGCDAHGLPSGHAMNSVIGLTSGWRVDIGIGIGAAAAVSTAGLRVAANRHTKTQVIAGLLLGAGAEWAGQAIVRCKT